MGNCIGAERRKKKRVDSYEESVQKWLEHSQFEQRELSSSPSEKPQCSEAEDNLHVIEAVEHMNEDESQSQANTSCNLEVAEIFRTPEPSTHEMETENASPFEYTTCPEDENDTSQEDIVENAIPQAENSYNDRLLAASLSSEEEDENIETSQSYRFNYDSRPVRQLPTPIKMHLMSPRTLECVVDPAGRPKRKKINRLRQLQLQKLEF